MLGATGSEDGFQGDARDTGFHAIRRDEQHVLEPTRLSPAVIAAGFKPNLHCVNYV